MGLFNRKKKAVEAEAEVQDQKQEATVQENIPEAPVSEENGSDETVPADEIPQESSGELSEEQIQILDANESKINRALAEIGRIFVERYMDDVPDEEIAEQYAVIQQCAEENNAILTSVMPEVEVVEASDDAETGIDNTEVMDEETEIPEASGEEEEENTPEMPETEEDIPAVSEAEKEETDAPGSADEETDLSGAPEEKETDIPEVTEATAEDLPTEESENVDVLPETTADENSDTDKEPAVEEEPQSKDSAGEPEILDFDAMDDEEFVSEEGAVITDDETAGTEEKPEELSEKLVKCPGCGELVPDDYYCDMCGEQLKELPEEEKPKVMYCSNCGGELLIGQPTCKKCGCDIIWGDEE